MTSSLRDALDELVTGVPAHLVASDLSATAWTAGRRRRIGRRLRTTAVLLVVLLAALGAALAPGAPWRSNSPTDGSSDGVHGYPQRVGHQWRVGDLPRRPGPLAALVQVNEDGYRYPWFGVSGSGYRWRLPIDPNLAGIPTLSPDGRHLGFLASGIGRYQIWDLVTGARTSFPEVSSLAPEPGPLYFVDDQTPAFWSPDGSHVAHWGGLRSGNNINALVLGLDGSVRVLSTPGAGGPVGWADDRTVVNLTWTLKPGKGEDPVVVRLTGLDGAAVRTLPLRPATPWLSPLFGQWSAVVAPDRATLLLLDGPAGEQVVRRFSLATGQETGTPQRMTASPICGIFWRGDTPVFQVPDARSNNVTTATLDAGGLRPLIAVQRGLATNCFVWAEHAIAGTPYAEPFGLGTGWLSWWWPEALSALAGLVIVYMGLWWLARRLVWRLRRARPGLR